MLYPIWLMQKKIKSIKVFAITMKIISKILKNSFQTSAFCSRIFFSFNHRIRISCTKTPAAWTLFSPLLFSALFPVMNPEPTGWKIYYLLMSQHFDLLEILFPNHFSDCWIPNNYFLHCNWVTSFRGSFLGHTNGRNVKTFINSRGAVEYLFMLWTCVFDSVPSDYFNKEPNGQ